MLLFITHSPIQAGMEQQARLFASHYGEYATIIPLVESMKLHHKIRLPQSKRLTVGIQAIEYFVKNQDQYEEDIILVGWDLDEFGNHYFKKQPVDSRYHDPMKEKAYLMKINLKNSKMDLPYVLQDIAKRKYKESILKIYFWLLFI